MRLIRGASGSGKTTLVFREFAAAVRAHRTDIRIVVPTATLVRHYQHELARSGLVFDPALIVSLSGFAHDCAPETQLASSALLRSLVRDALARLNLAEFSGVAATGGLTDIILETIQLFENADYEPERLTRGLSPRGKAFARIWKDVNAALARRGFSTRAQMIRAAAKNCPAISVWMDGFLKFSPVEATLVRALARTGDLTLAADSSADEIHRLALELGAKNELLPGAARAPQTTAVVAPLPEREADEIARRVLNLHEQGVEFPEIAVAVRDVEKWLPLLRGAFDRFGVPARFYFSSPVRNHPAAIFLDGLISSALADWDFEKALTALRAHPGWGRSSVFDRFDFRVRECMPGRGAENLLALCESEWLRTRLTECVKAVSWRDAARPAIWKQRLQQVSERLYRPGTIPAPRDYADIDAARSHMAAVRVWQSALETANEFLGEEAVSLARFHAALRDALDASTFQVADDRRNVVHVMSAFEARQWSVRALFVCGMTARDYPRRHAKNLLFSDGELARFGVRTSAEEDRDEEALFESLKTRASEFLILTASERDSGGKTAVLSQKFPENIARERTAISRPAPRYATAGAARAGNIGTTLLPYLADRHRTVSLTGLEDLAKCRFRFFAGRSLFLAREPDRPGKRLQPRVTGLIFHEAMEAWLPDRSRDFTPIFEQAFENACRERHIPPGYRLEVERIRLRRIADDVNEHVRWPVLESEAEVDCSLEFPGGIAVKCRVDRIDHIGGGDCVIVDYKSGKTDNVDKLIESQTSLQGPLYALAVREKKQLNPVAMVFLAIREGRAIGWGEIPGANLDLATMPPDWIDSARDRTIARLQDYLAGNVTAEPAHADHCRWCDYSAICRIETISVRTESAGA